MLFAKAYPSLPVKTVCPLMLTLAPLIGKALVQSLTNCLSVPVEGACATVKLDGLALAVLPLPLASVAVAP